jgi:hypothetical protein
MGFMQEQWKPFDEALNSPLPNGQEKQGGFGRI